MAYQAIPPVASGSLLDPWFGTTWTRIKALVPTLTNILSVDEMGLVIPNWDANITSTGTTTINTSSAVDLQSGTTSGALAFLTYKATATLNAKVVTNLRTAKYAMAVRVTKIATVATSQNYACRFSDGVGANLPLLGMIGATSTANYSVKVGSAAAVDTGVAQSAVGTYDTLIMLNDGTNLLVDINYAAPTNGASTSAATVVANAGYPEPLVTTGAAANSGLRIDKIMVVVAPAT